jgi:hypothetical protein
VGFIKAAPANTPKDSLTVQYEYAVRYQWLRSHCAAIIVGALSRERESLSDLTPERVDTLVDREIARTVAKLESAGALPPKDKS